MGQRSYDGGFEAVVLSSSWGIGKRVWLC